MELPIPLISLSVLPIILQLLCLSWKHYVKHCFFRGMEIGVNISISWVDNCILNLEYTGCLKKKNALFLWLKNLLEVWDTFHLKGGIHSSVLSTKTFLSNIRKLRYKQIKLGYQISKIIVTRPS